MAVRPPSRAPRGKMTRRLAYLQIERCGPARPPSLHPGTLGVQLDTPASPLQKPDPRVATDAGDQSQPSGGKRGGPGPRGPSPASPAPVISAGEVPPSAGRPSGGATGQEQGGLQANDSEWQKRRGDKVE